MLPGRESVVSLREITGATERAIAELAVHPSQSRFVTANAVSLAEARSRAHAWCRAVLAGETPVGFVMLEVVPGQPVFLWRFMIDARYQALGLGRRALDLVVAHARDVLGAAAVETTVVLGEGGPAPFYERAGFAFTGDFEEGQAV